MKKTVLFRKISLLTAAACMFALAACSPSGKEADTKDAETSEAAETTSEEAYADLTGETLMIYCGAGMQEPFEEIAAAFEEETGCRMEVVYANAAQIQTQINTTQEGACFIAGSKEEVTPVEEYVSDSKDLVLHIPVLAVQKENPFSISSPSDLANTEIRVITGNPESTPIGKIAVKMFEDYGITDQVNVVSETTTAPAMELALEKDECDAAIVWKENIDTDKTAVVAEEEMEAYIKTIPAARLVFSDDSDAADVFWNYLDTDEVRAVWTDFGYETVGK